ncbi:hypothetical protein II906_10650 [bacterium]|nr:hypothetical protein [bacterium]
MTNINPINLGVGANQYFKQDSKEELAKEASKKNEKEAPKKEISSNEILGYLAAVNADIVPAKAQKTVDVSKYVNEEQTARIADFMAAFEADFDEASAIALEEFPDITPETASNIALAYINSTY